MKKCTNCGIIEKDNERDFCTECGQRLVEIAEPKSNSEYIGQKKQNSDISSFDHPVNNEVYCDTTESHLERDDSITVSQAYKPALEHSGESFCNNCGIPFNEYGICVRCGRKISDQYKNSKRVKTYFSKLIDCIGVFFSASPFDGIENAARDQSHSIWLACLTIFAICSSLGLTNILHEPLNFGYFGIIVPLSEYFRMPYTFWGVEAMMIITVLLTFFISVLTLRLPLRLTRSRLSFVQLMNFNAFALLPLSIASLVAFLAAYLSTCVALFILPIGLIMSVIMLYYGLQKAASFHSSPYWLFAAKVACDSGAFLFIVWVVNEIAQ